LSSSDSEEVCTADLGIFGRSKAQEMQANFLKTREKNPKLRFIAESIEKVAF
jgi:hypothetical protein